MNKNIIYILISAIAILAIWTVWGGFGSRVETIKYSVIKKNNNYEIRQYEKHIIAKTEVAGSYQEASSQGFRILANYIFGGNKKKESIAMTAPVIAKSNQNISESIAMTAPVTATNKGDLTIISFSMPSVYTVDTLPVPDDSRIMIEEIPAKKYAVKRFYWYRTDQRIKKAQQKLITDLKNDGVVAVGLMSYAGYNAPFTPPWLLRNEVLVEVQ